MAVALYHQRHPDEPGYRVAREETHELMNQLFDLYWSGTPGKFARREDSPDMLPFALSAQEMATC